MTSTRKALEEIMADTAPGEASDFNTKIIEEFRANRGRVGGPLASTQLSLIHHTGAKSGTVRVTPLACNPQPDGRLAIVASNGGSPAHPDWYYNLKANPTITVEVGTQTNFAASADRAAINSWPCSLSPQMFRAPHMPPELPAGFGAVYAFALADSSRAPCGAGMVLKVGARRRPQ